MGNKVKFELKNSPTNLTAINAVVMDALQSSVLWSGLHPTTGGNTELDIGSSGAVGDGVWVYGNNASSGTESTAKTFGGYALIESGDVTPPQTYLLSDEFISVICTGDSIADLGSTENGVLRSINTKGWPSNTFAQSDQLFNMLPDSGIAGNTTQMLLDRLQTDVIDSGAQVAVIMLGTNDVHAQIDENVTIANMQSIVDQLVTAGMKVILTPITYRGDNHPTYTAKIDIINAAYANIAANNVDVGISSTFDEFNAIAIDDLRWEEVTIDRLHPNSSGAYLMGKVISQALDSNLQSTYPTNATQMVTNSQLLGTGGSTAIGATGQAPDNFNVFYAQPIVGVGVEYVTDGLVLRAGDGSTGGRTDAKLFQNVTVSNPLPSEQFLAKATVSVTKEMLSEISSMNITIKPNVGKQQNFLFNGEAVTAVFQEDYNKFVMRTLPTDLDPTTTTVEVNVTVVSRGNQDVEIKVYDLELIKVG